MNSLPSTFTFNRSYNEVLPWLTDRLSLAGLRVVQTFDLRLTLPLRVGHCTCPNHGTDECDCQLVILLIYGGMAAPLSLVLHGNDGQTWLSLVDRPGQQADTNTASAVQQVLQGLDDGNA